MYVLQTQINFNDITRLTVVDYTKDAAIGRALEKWGVVVRPDVQDGGCTLKLFLRDRDNND